MYKAILFDLDGTLTDSGEGIMKSVQYALEKIGHPEPVLDNLKVFVGPPLIPQMMRYAGIDEETARLAVQYYRERYVPIGIYENKLYPGIRSMLEELFFKGYKLGVASSKPEPFVNKILEHFEILQYFTVVVGSALDGTRSAKSEVVEEALLRLGLENDREAVVLVGDKNYDVYGARTAGLECLGVTFGYGSLEELEEAAPLRIVSSPEEITGFFRRTPLRKQGMTNRIWRVFYPIALHFGAQWISMVLFLAFAGGTAYRHTVLLTGLSGVIAAVPCYFWYRQDQRQREYGRLVPDPAGSRLNVGTALSLIAFGASLSLAGNMLMSLIMQLLPPAWNDNALAGVEKGQSFWWLLLWLGIVAPIAEEMIFRWLVYLRIRDHFPVWTSILITSALFGIYHMNVPQGLYAFLLGIFFAWALEMTGNIWASALLHCGANAFSLALQELGRFAGDDNAAAMVLNMLLLAAVVLGITTVIVVSISLKQRGLDRGYRAL